MSQGDAPNSSAESERACSQDECPHCRGALPPQRSRHALICCPGCKRIVTRVYTADPLGADNDEELPFTD